MGQFGECVTAQRQVDVTGRRIQVPISGAEVAATAEKTECMEMSMFRAAEKTEFMEMSMFRAAEKTEFMEMSMFRAAAARIAARSGIQVPHRCPDAPEKSGSRMLVWPF